MNSNSIPDLKYVGFEKEKLSLHLLLQMVGKIKLGLMPRKNHWWNITHYVNQQGFSTSTIPITMDSVIFLLILTLLNINWK
ncbi:DUF5996 family protein [uncultured Salegentibacter sp.]|uniref:DUF5996 family protein n=1 Tax=uncultured Salegentibacter sp. TaxID=259320 RepID=UPI002595D608|nr:DUF5996 family protein [uncultured Salegentibacter sp.]